MESRSKKTILSEHFTLEELTYSRTAVENGIANEPPPQIRTSLQHLADCLLEPLRQLYKKPIAVLSGFLYNCLNGSSKQSARCCSEVLIWGGCRLLYS